MTLVLYLHPLSSFCQKALIALYENGTAFEPRIVDLSDEASRAAFLRLWPIGKFPVLRDEARDRLVPESSVIIEYGDRLRPASERDAFGVAQAKARLQTAYAMIDAEMATQMWAAGETFTLADCAAAPALFYGRLVLPFGDAHLNLARYFASWIVPPSRGRSRRRSPISGSSRRRTPPLDASGARGYRTARLINQPVQ